MLRDSAHHCWCLFACHGAQKLFGVLGGQSEIHDPEGLVAGLVEFIAGTLIALGLLREWPHLRRAARWPSPTLRHTRVGAFGPSLTMGSWPFYTALSSSTSSFAELGFGASNTFGLRTRERLNDAMQRNSESFRSR